MSSPVDLKSACCTVPPVEGDYSPKGSYKTLEGLNTYVTGPSDAKTLIINVFDIFGLTPQAIQGADLTSAGAGAQVWMPDLLEDNWADHAWFSPPETKEKSEAKSAYFSGVANPENGLKKLTPLIAHARSLGFTKVASVGFCWGAKLVFSASDLDAKAACHPSFLAKGDADSQTVPIALFPSKDEDPEIMAELEKTLSSKPFAAKNVYHLFPDSPHGFAGARANLKDEGDKKVFHDAYVRLGKFFTAAL